MNEAIGDVRDDKNPFTWVVAGFENGDPKKQLVVVARGEGDVEELKENLQVNSPPPPPPPPPPPVRSTWRGGCRGA